jgi:hypothetical protein
VPRIGGLRKAFNADRVNTLRSRSIEGRGSGGAGRNETSAGGKPVPPSGQSVGEKDTARPGVIAKPVGWWWWRVN